MTQVSKYPLRKEIEKRMFEVFLDSVAMVTTRNKVMKLLTDLLSPTEQTMLAKRLAIALLLTKKYDQRSVMGVLKVSLGTVNKINRALKNGSGGYDMVISSMIKQEKFQEFIDKLDDALTELLVMGRKVPTLRQKHWEEKRERQKPF